MRSSLVLALMTALAAPLALASIAAADGAAPKPAAVVKLVNGGTGAKEALRYKFKKGQKDSVTVESDMSMKMSVGGKDVPPMTLPTISQKIQVEILEVTPDGTAKYRAKLQGAKIMGKPDAEVKAMIEKELDAVKDAAFTGSMSARGEQTALKAELGANTAPQAKEMMDGIISGLKMLMPALPEEPVGTGASWTSEGPVSVKFGTVQQKTTYKLTAKKGETLSVDATVEQSASPQAIDAPGIPAGAGAKLTSFKGTGSGSTKVRLSHLSADGEIKSQVDLSMAAKGQTVQMGMTTAMRLKK